MYIINFNKIHTYVGKSKYPWSNVNCFLQPLLQIIAVIEYK